MRKAPLYKAIAETFQAYCMCLARNNEEWEIKHKEKLFSLVEMLPSGSGIDRGVVFDITESTPNKLKFTLGFHHMNNDGFYDGWTEHTITVTPDLVSDLDIKIGGRNRNDIKDYLHDTLRHALTQEIEY